MIIKKPCPFCQSNIKEINYLDEALRKFTSMQGRIAYRKRSGVCAKHQRKLAQAIKRARHLALLPFVYR
jgi:small subunit ribosomal protein S18